MENIKFEVMKKVADTNFKFRDLKKISKIDSVSPPSVFIGSKLRYPLVNIGILSPLEKEDNAWIYDDAKYWAEKDFQISDVVKLRNNLLNSKFQSKVQDSRLNKKFVGLTQEIAVAAKPVDVEIELKNNLNFKKSKDKVTTPQGMRAGLKKATIIGNVKIHKKVEKVMNDEIKAAEAMRLLYKNNFDEYSLSKILSVGVVGLKKNKRFVPTRWSITATDDTLGKQLLEQVKMHKWIENYGMFFGEFMGNQYLILMFPNVWSYELFELYYPGSSWNPSNEMKAATDFESYSGRKTYASDTAGGYYATRLPILKYLNKIKRQASVLVIRLETPSYWASLGVWVCRESIRKTLNYKNFKFNSKEEMLNSAKIISEKKFEISIDFILKRSKLLRQIQEERRLGEWF
ncbi:hypothetical protein KAI04_00985 [Candidatus Pacearchaeota archaeon]|nr:hypothetical protein [Candidatus Pacearchaeota archaeon]